MDAFGYLSVLISIILGLAVTQLLQGYRGVVLGRRRIHPYAPALWWGALLLLIDVQSWWAMFGLSEKAQWTFAEFAAVLLQTVLLYMLAALVLPDVSGDREVDLREHYFTHRRWFFGAAVLTAVASLGKDLVIAGHLPNAANVGFHVLFIASALAAMVLRAEWYHRLLPVTLLVTFAGYITALFARLR
jgi:hypothetical protein